MRAALDGAARARPGRRAAAGRAAAGRPRRARRSSRRTGCGSTRAPARRCSTSDAASLERRDAASAADRLVRPLVPPAERRRCGSSAPRSGTATRSGGSRPSTPTSAWSPWIRATRRPGTTWGCSSTAWGSYERARGVATRRRSGPTRAAARRCSTWARSHEDLGDFAVPVTLVPARARAGRRLRRRPLQSGRRARQARAGPRARPSTGGATSSSTSAARGRKIARAHLEECAEPAGGDPEDRRVTERAPGRRRRARARAGLEARPEPAASSAWWPRPAIPASPRHARCVPSRTPRSTDWWRLAQRERPDLVVVGPEVPLALGLADRLRAAGLAVFGPSAAAAAHRELEGLRQGPDGPPRRADRALRARSTTRPRPGRYCRELGAPLVVKADGLAAGKGVDRVPPASRRPTAAIAQCSRTARVRRRPALTVVVEEFLRGRGGVVLRARRRRRRVLPLVAAQDHKTVFDDDRGPNTGGMGAYSPAPVIDAAMQDARDGARSCGRRSRRWPRRARRTRACSTSA